MTDRRILILRTALLWILLELLAAAQVRAPSGEIVLWSWARAAASPVVWLGSRIGDLVSGLVVGVTETQRLVTVNRELRLELETVLAHRLLMTEDVAALLDLNSLAAGVPSLDANAVPSRIAYRNLAQGQMIVHLAGDHRLPPDTPAVAKGGVVGRVIKSDRRRCWIELITHPVAAIAVQTQDGLIHGLSTGSDSGKLEIQFVSRQAELLRGATLITSGADGIYPPGLPVGRVTAVRESADAFLQVRAEPTAALATARVVLLLRGWTVPRPTGDPTR